MTTVFLLEEMWYTGPDNYADWFPDTEAVYATEDLAQAEANRRNHDLTARWIAAHIAGQTGNIRSWQRRKIEHDALYAAGIRPQPFSEKRPTYSAPNFRGTVASLEGWWTVESALLVEA